MAVRETLLAADFKELLLQHNTEKGVTQHHSPHPSPHAVLLPAWPRQPRKWLVPWLPASPNHEDTRWARKWPGEYSLSANQFHSDSEIKGADKLISNRRTRIPNVPSKRKHIKESSAEITASAVTIQVALGPDRTKMVLLLVHHVPTCFYGGQSEIAEQVTPLFLGPVSLGRPCKPQTMTKGFKRDRQQCWYLMACPCVSTWTSEPLGAVLGTKYCAQTPEL